MAMGVCSSTVYTPRTPSKSFLSRRSHARHCRRRSVKAKGLQDDLEKLARSLAFENWAPKSSRMWRLGQDPNRDKNSGQTKEDNEEMWQNRLEDVRDLGSSSRTSEGSNPTEDLAPMSSFSESTDEELSSALSRRIEDMVESPRQEESADGSDAELTGEELKQLIFDKYGKYYDAEFAIREFMGKDLVSLNIMWVHMQQQSFPMTKEYFYEKLDGIAILLNSWNQAGKVRRFLKSPRKAVGGRPSKPVMGSAVSIELDLTDATINKWFKQH